VLLIINCIHSMLHFELIKAPFIENKHPAGTTNSLYITMNRGRSFHSSQVISVPSIPTPHIHFTMHEDIKKKKGEKQNKERLAWD
jgi:hypothetical protein